MVALGVITQSSIDPDGSAGGAPQEGFEISPISAADGLVTCAALFSTVPVILTDFNVSKRDRDADLKWITRSEINTSHFKIYRSTDGLSWDYVGTEAAAGNSSDKIEYNFTDANANRFANAEGVLYYRIRTIDFDGFAKYSPIRNVNFDGGGMVEKFTVYPNPTAGEIFVTSNNLSTYAQPKLDVYNVFGQKVASINLSHGNDGDTQKLDLRDYNLAPGTYLLEVMHNEQIISLGKIALFN